ncbi:hypothetical protein GGF49_005346 [Coemansia sp. RSA 1853]|nr:hypothetical protein LPJ76_003912 [Coemansia sp. RSA 638]KAJ2539264.1 hypothetical protein GGF49_005346 [Coemansia sp. RSA 1853]
MRFSQRAGSNGSTGKSTETRDDASDVTHLLILVPGTGPQSESETPKGTFTKKAVRFREMLRSMCAQEFEHTGANVEMVRILYHADLHALETAKERMDKVTLPSIPWIRSIDNERIGDILYYYSTAHGHRMLAMVISKLNAAYTSFIAAHPTFKGPVSIVAHSLGGLICYEILYMMHARRRGCVAGGEWETQRFAGLPDLEFAPERLFTMGSPHGGTMVFRHLDFDEYTMGPVGFHNIFHPYDPFGYRTETLVDDAYADIPAVPISVPSSRSSSRLTRHSLGSSMAGLGKTLVDAVVVAPVTLSSTMLRVARSSVSAPSQARHTGEPHSHMHRISSLLGITPSDKSVVSEPATEDEHVPRGQRKRSISRLLPFSFARRFERTQEDESQSTTPEDESASTPEDKSPSTTPVPSSTSSANMFSFACNSHVAATLGAMADTHEHVDDSVDSNAAHLHTYAIDNAPLSLSIDSSAGPVSGETHAGPVAGETHAGPVPVDAHAGTASVNVPQEPQGSAELSDEAETREDSVSDHMEDMMLSQLMRIFSLSRPPGRDQQLAEAQGLPLSSRVMSLRRTKLHPTRTVSPALHEPCTASVVPCAATCDAQNDSVRRANTLPLALADGRRMVRAMTGPVPREHTFDNTQKLELPQALCHSVSASAVPSRLPTPPAEHMDEASPVLTIDTPSEPALPYPERMDYIVPFTKRHLQNEYWLGFQAHYSYWTSRDVVYHILHHIIKP